MLSADRADVLADEWLLVRHSGEIPEIAFHSALHYLTEDRDGPRLWLTKEEIDLLLEAASARYQEIIFRDLCYENRKLGVYRGLKRAISNWNRFLAFRQRRGHTNDPAVQVKVAQELLALLQIVAEKESSFRDDDQWLPLIFNCTGDDLIGFSCVLGIPVEKVPASILRLCHP